MRFGGCESSRIPMSSMSTSTACAERWTRRGTGLSFERCEVWAMSSETAKPIMRSAAWCISLWATLAFACGTMVVFVFLHQFVAGDIQRRTDAWLAGEAGVLSDVAARTPKWGLYRRVVGEVAELASREGP